MAEEGEVIGLEPMKKVLVFGELGRAAGHQVVESVVAGLAQRPPVLDRHPYLGQDASERGGKVVEQGAVAPVCPLPVDLQIHHRFRPGPLAGFVRHLDQVAIEVAPHRQHRMGQQVHAELPAIELVGDRIDQERHVVVDDLDDGVAALEAVVGERRIEHPHLGDAGQAAAGKGEQRAGRGGTLLGRGGRQILVGHALEQATGELGCFLAARAAECGGADRIQPPNTRRQCYGHCPNPRSLQDRELCSPRSHDHERAGCARSITASKTGVGSVTIRRRILGSQKCPSHGPFRRPPRRRAARWLAFLFGAHGFRGKARFVLIFCCSCEGLHTIEKGNRPELFFRPISAG
jgi:hypothetical protein